MQKFIQLQKVKKKKKCFIMNVSYDKILMDYNVQQPKVAEMQTEKNIYK